MQVEFYRHPSTFLCASLAYSLMIFLWIIKASKFPGRKPIEHNGIMSRCVQDCAKGLQLAQLKTVNLTPNKPQTNGFDSTRALCFQVLRNYPSLLLKEIEM